MVGGAAWWSGRLPDARPVLRDALGSIERSWAEDVRLRRGIPRALIDCVLELTGELLRWDGGVDLSGSPAASCTPFPW